MLRTIPLIWTDLSSARGWFFGFLRNAIVDYHRRSTVADTAHQRIAHEWPTTTSPEDATTSCGCIDSILCRNDCA